MKYLIISDIHGSPVYLKQCLDIFKKDGYDFILILGDILYHGPRNRLTDGYDPSTVVELLNEVSDKIIAARGNCDAEVDQMLLDFPCQSDYSLVVDGDVQLFLTHGHVYDHYNFPIKDKTRKQVFLSGHTHIWVLDKIGNLTICNPGSITLPKGGNPNTYATYIDGHIAIHDFEGNIVAEADV